MDSRFAFLDPSQRFFRSHHLCLPSQDPGLAVSRGDDVVFARIETQFLILGLDRLRHILPLFSETRNLPLVPSSHVIADTVNDHLSVLFPDPDHVLAPIVVT